MEYFSTDDIPARDRMALFHDVVARHIAGRAFTAVSRAEIRVEIAAFGLPDQVTVATGSYSPIYGARTRELLNDGRDNYLLTIHTREHEVSVDGRKPMTVPAGNLMLINEAICSNFQLPETAVKVVSLKRSRLARLVPRIEVEAFHHIPVVAPGMPLLTGYADILRENPPQGEQARQIAANHLHDLAALVLDGFVNGGAARNEVGIRAVRLDLIKKEVLRHLQDPDFGIDAAARRQGITPRYIQRLFEAEGVTFSEFLRASRLDMAFRLLRQSTSGESTISALAYDCGFRDISTFNRGFQRRYGATPSDVRADTMRRRYD
ncbi:MULTISPECIES: helix-turn-helix transcriptional regulator [unclassified Mesorhizobium]|uniref:helix-turn-helix transcriptional regulator n=1 Tax=unclassified Mesorhizobium TaxID=325217 RepID=UPI00112A77DA|nr:MULTISPECIES: helix-turn-helix transcriptional regulator [unclassified Mesorhizobium]TPL05570.1 helix-turn-helix transcriptional regulator [Mesorhizobium sp. B2-4-16]TPL75337.1 helix-turn-helix transcriptional regulator [Mesorhizobium sp. B2-4-3]